MAHVEPSRLVELALGHMSFGEEDLAGPRHIQGCARCRDELRLLARVVAAARGARVADLPAAPPERVWRDIVRELSGEGAG